MNITSDDIKRLVAKYPYLIPVNVWTGKPSEDYDFTYMRGFHELPEGWTRLFLLFCKNLLPHLENSSLLDKFYFTQLKEKYGTMRIYTSVLPESVDFLVSLYENFSKQVCSKCGNPAKYHTKWWIEYLCENCIDTHDKKDASRVHKEKVLRVTVFSNGSSSIEERTYKHIRREYLDTLKLSDQQFVEYLLN